MDLEFSKFYLHRNLYALTSSFSTLGEGEEDSLYYSKNTNNSMEVLSPVSRCN